LVRDLPPISENKIICTEKKKKRLTFIQNALNLVHYSWKLLEIYVGGGFVLSPTL